MVPSRCKSKRRMKRIDGMRLEKVGGVEWMEWRDEKGRRRGGGRRNLCFFPQRKIKTHSVKFFFSQINWNCCPKGNKTC